MYALHPVEPQNVNPETIRQLTARAGAVNIQNARVLAERAAQEALEAASRVTRTSNTDDLLAALSEAKLQVTLGEITKIYARAEMCKIAKLAITPLLHEAQVDVWKAEQAVANATSYLLAIKSLLPPSMTPPVQSIQEDLRALDNHARTSISPARVVIIRSAQVAFMATYAQSELYEALEHNTVLTAETAEAKTRGYHQKALACRALVEENLARVDRATSTTLTRDFALALAATTSAFHSLQCADLHLRQLRAANPPRPRPPTPNPPAKTAT